MLNFVLFTEKLCHLCRDTFVIVLHPPFLVQRVTTLKQLAVIESKTYPGVFLHDSTNLDKRISLQHVLVFCEQIWAFTVHLSFQAHLTVLVCRVSRSVSRIFRVTSFT